MASSFQPEPEHEIDLHGLRVAQALRHLKLRLTVCRSMSIPRVRIITGRGWGSPGGKARLKPAVEEWLLGPEGRALGVREISEASQGGAWDVMLTRTP
ncbi:MAG: DNA-nicking Smr family endonuclease [Planctomycetota bacterium]|jgi:DNA-nicking Smr family endonuclease